MRKKMNLTTEHEKIVNPDNAIALLVENPKKVMQNGITRPPPPMPPTVEIEVIIIKRVRPTNSLPRIGNTSLC